MEQFDHLAVFISMIIALGVSQLIVSVGTMIHLRGKVRIYYPTLILMVFLLLLQTLIWWVLFYRHDTSNWQFFRFILYLITPIIVSMLGNLLVPEIKAETDLKEIYFHNYRLFYGLLAFVALLSLPQGDATTGGLRLSLDFWFRAMLVVFSITGVVNNSKRLQLPLALAFLCWILVYITIFFTRLG